MKVRIQCPHCNKILTIPTTLAGKKGRCPGCQQVLQIPANLTPSEPESPPRDQVYDAEDASTTPPSMSDPTDPPSPYEDADTNYTDSQDDDLGYGLSSDLLSELDKQPALPSQNFSEPERVPCPVCKEPIVRGATKCHHCGEIFDLVLKAHEKHKESKKRKYHSDDDDLTIVDILIAIFCSCIGCILAVVWMIQGKKKGLKMLGVCILANFIWTIIEVLSETATQVNNVP